MKRHLLGPLKPLASPTKLGRPHGRDLFGILNSSQMIQRTNFPVESLAHAVQMWVWRGNVDSMRCLYRYVSN